MTPKVSRIWSDGDYAAGTLRWGWTCRCGKEADGFDTATAARESWNRHIADFSNDKHWAGDTLTEKAVQR